MPSIAAPSCVGQVLAYVSQAICIHLVLLHVGGVI